MSASIIIVIATVLGGFGSLATIYLAWKPTMAALVAFIKDIRWWRCRGSKRYQYFYEAVQTDNNFFWGLSGSESETIRVLRILIQTSYFNRMRSSNDKTNLICLAKAISGISTKDDIFPLWFICKSCNTLTSHSEKEAWLVIRRLLDKVDLSDKRFCDTYLPMIDKLTSLCHEAISRLKLDQTFTLDLDFYTENDDEATVVFSLDFLHNIVCNSGRPPLKSPFQDDDVSIIQLVRWTKYGRNCEIILLSVFGLKK